MRKAELIVLCEDAQHERFIRRFLRAMDFNPRQFRIRPYPAGARSGEQSVREKYPAEARALRQRANHSSASLVTITDADALTVEQRAQQLDDALHAAGHERRGRDERIALVIPRRNLESWIHFGVQGVVDETTDFKTLYRSDGRAHRHATDAALTIHRTAPEEGTAPPSLVTACRELRRIVES